MRRLGSFLLAVVGALLVVVSGLLILLGVLVLLLPGVLFGRIVVFAGSVFAALIVGALALFLIRGSSALLLPRIPGPARPAGETLKIFWLVPRAHRLHPLEAVGCFGLAAALTLLPVGGLSSIISPGWQTLLWIGGILLCGAVSVAFEDLARRAKVRRHPDAQPDEALLWTTPSGIGLPMLGLLPWSTVTGVSPVSMRGVPFLQIGLSDDAPPAIRMGRLPFSNSLMLNVARAAEKPYAIVEALLRLREEATRGAAHRA